jgi:hypothetical protein
MTEDILQNGSNHVRFYLFSSVILKKKKKKKKKKNRHCKINTIYEHYRLKYNLIALAPKQQQQKKPTIDTLDFSHLISKARKIDFIFH